MRKPKRPEDHLMMATVARQRRAIDQQHMDLVRFPPHPPVDQRNPPITSLDFTPADVPPTRVTETPLFDLVETAQFRETTIRHLPLCACGRIDTAPNRLLQRQAVRDRKDIVIECPSCRDVLLIPRDGQRPRFTDRMEVNT